MLKKLKFEEARIPFEGTEADEVSELDLHKANQLCKDGKYRGALFCYDSVITNALEQITGSWNRMSELRVAYLTKCSYYKNFSEKTSYGLLMIVRNCSIYMIAIFQCLMRLKVKEIELK